MIVTALAFISFATAQTVGVAEESENTTYYCVYVESSDFSAENFDGQVDLTMIRRPTTEDYDFETWLLRWPDRPEYDALAFDIEFGSHGGSRGLQWKDEGDELKRGFISFSDIASPDSSGLWFALDRPSLWQPPGYGCETNIDWLDGGSE